MKLPDDDYFATAGRMLARRSPADTSRVQRHAQVTQGLLVADERHWRRHRAKRRVALNVAAVATFAAVIFLVAQRVPGVLSAAGGNVVSDSAGAVRETMVTFTLDADRATQVALVGEFNSWNARATPMSRTGDGKWQVQLPVAPGRHTYAFVVDDSSWTADPGAPRAPERWFGESRSVLVVANNP